MTTSKHLISITKAASQLGLSEWQLRRLADTGRVPVELTSGGHRRFDVSAVRVALNRLSSPNQLDHLPPAPWDRELSLDGLRESDVWIEASNALGLAAGEDAYAVFHYAFTEILNNSIDHSGGSTAHVRVWSDPIAFEIADNGVGAFERLRTGLGLDTDEDAVFELTKGKATSDPANHTGQGIFFTSKVLDVFRLEANGLMWTVDNNLSDQALGASDFGQGTRATGVFSKTSSRKLADVFAVYTNEEFAFARTSPSIKLLEMGTSFVSRSEAKLLLARLDAFETVELDFDGIQSIGQGFADEVFRVWPTVHPGTKIVPTNMNPGVEFMVRRGLAERR